MKTKSKVTSIRVEPELYENFKAVLDAQGRQISHVISDFLKIQVEANNKVNDLIARSEGLIKPVSEYSEYTGWRKFKDFDESVLSFSKEVIQQFIAIELEETNRSFGEPFINPQDVRMYFTGVTVDGRYTFFLSTQKPSDSSVTIKQLLDKFAWRLTRGLKPEVEMRIAVPKPWFNEMKKFDGAKLNASAVLELSEVRLPEYPNFIFHFCDIPEPVIAKIEKKQ